MRRDSVAAMRRVAAYVVVCVVACVVALTACGKRAPHDEPPPPLDRSTIYPLIVRASDLPSGPVRKPLVEGLVVTLAAQSQGAEAAGQAQPAGQAKLLREPDLQGMSLDDAYTTALANLEAAARRGEIHVNAEVGSAGRPVDVVWGHDWRAAACLLLPGVRQQAEQQLVPRAAGSAAIGSANPDAPRVYAVIPNRDVLVLFADPAIAAKALAAEKGAPRPISDRVLRALPTDQPFWVQAPVAWMP